MNYSGIVKQMVCKATVLLALALIACSEDSKSIADGGTAEERGLQAKNFTISGRAGGTGTSTTNASVMPTSFDSLSMQGSFIRYGSVLYPVPFPFLIYIIKNKKSIVFTINICCFC